jgi:hypothetical protein
MPNSIAVASRSHFGKNGTLWRKFRRVLTMSARAHSGSRASIDAIATPLARSATDRGATMAALSGCIRDFYIRAIPSRFIAAHIGYSACSFDGDLIVRYVQLMAIWLRDVSILRRSFIAARSMTKPRSRWPSVAARSTDNPYKTASRRGWRLAVDHADDRQRGVC